MADVDREQPSAGSLTADELDYELPEHLIATRPAEPRDSARMLVMRCGGGAIEHRHVRDLPEYLQPGDVLVLNTTAVAPARLVGRRAATGGRVEGLLLAEAGSMDALHEPCWEVMLRSNGRLRPGQRIVLDDTSGQPSKFGLELVERREETWIVRPFQQSLAGEPLPIAALASILDAVGRTPLPPYILQARGEHAVADAMDRAWYQTVYAGDDAASRRSVAAPTAGLHFTPDLLATLDRRGVQRLDVMLHVGAGTFKPVTTPTLAEHRMHSEQYEVPPRTLAALAQGRSRVIAVGTTTVRTLESLPDPLPADVSSPIQGETDLLIAPPYRFRHVEGLLTNFHLPRSTLLALVAAFVGLDRVKAAYAEAVERGYRFYSYGDAMLILP